MELSIFIIKLKDEQKLGTNLLINLISNIEIIKNKGNDLTHCFKNIWFKENELIKVISKKK